MDTARKSLGITFLLASIVFLYLFAVWGVIDTKELTGKQFSTLVLPFYSLFKSYPKNVIVFTLGILLFSAGLALLLVRGSITALKSIPRLFLINSILSFAFLWITFVGSKANAEPKLMAIFSIICVLQIIAGALILFKSFKEKPLPIISLATGGLFYILCVIVCVVSILSVK